MSDKKDRVQGMVGAADRWAEVSTKAVISGSSAQAINVLTDAIHDIGCLWRACQLAADEIVRLNDLVQAFEFDKEAHASALARLKRYEDETRDLKAQIVDAWNAFGGQSWTADHIEDLPFLTEGTLAEQIEELTSQRDKAELENERLTRERDEAVRLYRLVAEKSAELMTIVGRAVIETMEDKT